MKTLFVFVLAWNAHAGTIQECYESSKKNIKQASDDLEKRGEEADARNNSTAERSKDVRIQGGGGVMSGAYFAEAVSWKKLADSSKKLIEDCRRKCQVEPSKQNFADRYVQQCEEKIGKIVKGSEGSERANTQAAADANASSATADDQRASEQRVLSSRDGTMRDEVIADNGQRLPSDIAPEHIGDVQQTGVISSHFNSPDGTTGSVTAHNGGGSTLKIVRPNGTTTTSTYDSGGNMVGGFSTLGVGY